MGRRRRTHRTQVHVWRRTVQHRHTCEETVINKERHGDKTLERRTHPKQVHVWRQWDRGNKGGRTHHPTQAHIRETVGDKGRGASRRRTHHPTHTCVETLGDNRRQSETRRQEQTRWFFSVQTLLASARSFPLPSFTHRSRVWRDVCVLSLFVGFLFFHHANIIDDTTGKAIFAHPLSYV